MAAIGTSVYRSSRSIQEQRRRALIRAITYVSLLTCGLLFCFPFFWTLSSSLKTAQEVRLVPPQLLPEIVQWHNYARVWIEQPILRWLLNSVIIIGLTVPGAIITALLVAYSFARFDYPGRAFFFMVMLSTLMIPFEVTLIPQYILFQKIGWVNTYYPLVLPAWAGGGAFVIFLLRQFLLTIPRDLDEAAYVDGANTFQILWSILVPLCRPALATVAILEFLTNWNDFLRPFIFLNSQELFTMSVGLRYFKALPETAQEPKDHLLMAATIIMTIPAIIIFFAAQRYFVRGIVMSGLKM
jgi:multiple sugar transport system permease protein